MNTNPRHSDITALMFKIEGAAHVAVATLNSALPGGPNDGWPLSALREADERLSAALAEVRRLRDAIHSEAAQ